MAQVNLRTTIAGGKRWTEIMRAIRISVVLHPANTSSALAAPLAEQARQKFAEVIAAMPECTMEELAEAVREYPVLASMTLHELLARVRRPDRDDGDLEPRLRVALAKLVRPLPPMRISPAALERISETDLDVIGPIVAVARAARRRGVAITRIIIVPESLGPDDVAVALEIGPHPQRQAMWRVVERMAPKLPPTLWLSFL